MCYNTFKDMSMSSSLTLNNVFLVAQNSFSEKMVNLDSQMRSLPSVLDKETLNDLVEGEYDITLQQYTDMNSYRNSMQLIHGNNSANPVYSGLNRLMGNGSSNNTTVSASNFIERMKDRGLSETSAFSLYTAVRTYSINNSLLSANNSFVNAKI